MTDNGVADLAERLEGFDAFQNKTDLEDAEWILSDGSRFLSREAAERQEAIEEAARRLLDTTGYTSEPFTALRAALEPVR